MYEIIIIIPSSKPNFLDILKNKNKKKEIIGRGFNHNNQPRWSYLHHDCHIFFTNLLTYISLRSTYSTMLYNV